MRGGCTLPRMAKTSVPASTTPATQRPVLEAIRSAVKELQGLKAAVVAGAGANTNIAVAGIATADIIVASIEHDPDGTPILVDRTSTTSITSAGNVQCSVATTGSQLVILYLDVSAN